MQRKSSYTHLEHIRHTRDKLSDANDNEADSEDNEMDCAGRGDSPRCPNQSTLIPPFSNPLEIA
uniref:Uncharacterized protein n=1 Tax=Glossina morsitans morsitans TaxID=37546 RepID=A0A1B0FD06_GLOMM